MRSVDGNGEGFVARTPLASSPLKIYLDQGCRNVSFFAIFARIRQVQHQRTQDKETKMGPLEFCYLVSWYNCRALGKDLYNVPLLASTLKTERPQLSHMS
jgi:hypothetical protein